MKSALLIALLAAAALIFGQGADCTCRKPPGGETSYTYCYGGCADSPNLPQYPVIAGQHSISFFDGTTLCPLFIKSSWLAFPTICPDDGFDFPEARAQCLPLMDIYQNDSAPLYVGPFWGLTATNNARYFIPYCYGLDTLYLYRTVGLGADMSFELEASMPLHTPIETLKIFGDTVVLVDFEKINLYKLQGKALRKVAEAPFPHDPLALSCNTLLSGAKGYGEIWNYIYREPYLYLVPTYYMPEYGQLLTYELRDGRLDLVQADKDLPVSYGSASAYGSLSIEEIDGVVYLLFYEGTYCDLEHTFLGVTNVFRIQSGLPQFLYPFYTAPQHQFSSPLVGVKNRYTYFWFGQSLPPSPICEHVEVFRFQNGQIVDTGKDISDGHSYFSDNAGFDWWYSEVLCSAEDDYPTYVFDLYPLNPVSGRFIISGTASDSEGIRSVFIGAPWYPYLHRAEVYKRDATTSYWMAVLDGKYFNPQAGLLRSTVDHDLVTVVEDMDGDSNMNFDNLWYEQLSIINVAAESDPMPFGEMDERPHSTDKILVFSGWALDQGGIRRGWLLSEDAQVLTPLTTGCERPDIAARYPEYPDALHSGFDVVYDLAGVPDGEYEFTVRLMAEDFQVLDFGPYTVNIDRTHGRPLAPP